MKKIDIHLHSTLEKNDLIFNHVHIAECDTMKKHLEELNIEKAIVMSFEKETDPLSSNKLVKQIAARHPETFYWFCNIEPDVDNVYENIKQKKEQGAKGFGEWVTNKRLDHDYMYQIMSACEQLELPILFHISPEKETYYGVVDLPGLPLLEKALKNFPKLKFIGHSQPFWYEISGNKSDETSKRNGYPTGKVEPGGRLIELLHTYPNLYCDLSANSGGNAIMRDPEFGYQFLEEFQDRLFFGSDMANETMIFPLGAWLDSAVSSHKISKITYEKICRENAFQYILN